MADPTSPQSDRPRLFLIDGYSNIFRAFYAIRNLSNSRGEPTNAVYGFVQMLRKLLREENPELVGVALDVGKTFRNEKFEDYKANRRPMPEDLASQLPWVRRVLEAYRIPILELAGYEADDVLGTLSCRAAADGYDVVLVSADKDLMQLVEPRVSLYHTGRNKLYGPQEVTEDFGVPPEKVVDVLALMGDSIDNIPGVPGIGEKGAKSLIQEYGSLDELLARAGEITRKAYREGLLANEAQARLSKELTTIHTNVEIAFDPKALRHDPPDTDALRKLFTELEFFSLVEELGPADALGGAGGTAAATEELPAAERATTPEAWNAAVAKLAGEIHVAVLGEEPPLGLAVASGEDGPAVYADFRRDGCGKAALAALDRWAGRARRPSLRSQSKGSAARLPRGSLCRAALFDTMLVSYLLKPSVHAIRWTSWPLERLARKPLTLKEVGWDKGQEPAVGDSRLAAYAASKCSSPAASPAPCAASWR